MNTGDHILAKTVWTDADFEQMGWHDVRIYAIGFHPERLELWIDVDYILRWDGPEGEDKHYSFWVAPATLVFEGAYDFSCKLVTREGDLSFQEITRSAPKAGSYLQGKPTEWHWRLELNEGEIGFRAAGYTQFIRRPPTHQITQKLTFDERGGISFDRKHAT